METIWRACDLCESILLLYIHRLYMYQTKQNSVCVFYVYIVQFVRKIYMSMCVCVCVLRKKREKLLWNKMSGKKYKLFLVYMCVHNYTWISTIYILCSDDALNIYRKLSIFICHNTMRYKIESFSWFSGCLMFTMIFPDIDKKKDIHRRIHKIFYSYIGISYIYVCMWKTDQYLHHS